MLIKASLLLLFFPIFLPISAFANAVDLSNFFKGNKAKDIQKIVGYKNQPVPGQNLPLEQAEGLGTKAREESEVFNTKATLERATKMEKFGFIHDEDGNVRNNKGFLDKAKQTLTDAKNNLNILTGGYTDCLPNQESVINKTFETCEEYYNVKHNSCFARQLVEIDPKYTYQCSKKREVKEKLCEDVLKSLKCKQSAECDSGGIVLKSLASDMKWVYGYPILTLGTIADNYWHSSCGNFTRSTKFEVKNKNLIDEFRIIEVGYDDYLRITINGSQVYNGPFGGERLEIINQWFFMVNTGSGGTHSCELNTNSHANVSIDLVPYLLEGINELIMEVVVAGAGEGWAKIRTRQHCCTEWIEEREEQCTFL